MNHIGQIISHYHKITIAMLMKNHDTGTLYPDDLSGNFFPSVVPHLPMIKKVIWILFHADLWLRRLIYYNKIQDRVCSSWNQHTIVS